MPHRSIYCCPLQICCMLPTSTCRAGLIGSSRDSTTSLPCLAAILLDILIDTRDAEPETVPTRSTAEKFDVSGVWCQVQRWRSHLYPRWKGWSQQAQCPLTQLGLEKSCSVLCPKLREFEFRFAPQWLSTNNLIYLSYPHVERSSTWHATGHRSGKSTMNFLHIS